MGPRSRTPSFTLIELVVTLTIVAILAATAVPKLATLGTRRLAPAAWQLATHIRFARNLAMTACRRTWVEFNVSGNSYSVYIEDPDTPGRSDRILATHPETRGDFNVILNSGDFDGIEVDTASFGGRAEVEFDWLGQPYNGMGSLLASDGTVVLGSDSATRTVRVVAETGMVQEE